MQDKKIQKYLKVIDQIAKTRTNNNINWMNILRVAIKNAPDETIQIMKKIDKRDRKISRLFKKLSK